MDKFSYGLGLGIGQQLLSMGQLSMLTILHRPSAMYWKVKRLPLASVKHNRL